MAYVMTLLDCQWSAVADRLEARRDPADTGLVRHIRMVLGHHPRGCTCEIGIDLSPEQAQLVRTALPEIEAAALATID